MISQNLSKENSRNNSQLVNTLIQDKYLTATMNCYQQKLPGITRGASGAKYNTNINVKSCEIDNGSTTHNS